MYKDQIDKRISSSGLMFSWVFYFFIFFFSIIVFVFIKYVSMQRVWQGQPLPILWLRVFFRRNTTPTFFCIIIKFTVRFKKLRSSFWNKVLGVENGARQHEFKKLKRVLGSVHFPSASAPKIQSEAFLKYNCRRIGYTI